jgi:hypothetical protein
MTQDITTTTGSGNGLVQLDPAQFANQLASYGADEQARAWVGQLLKFVKGKDLAGKDETVIPLGTKLTMAIDALEVGWERWQDKQLVDSRMGLISQGYRRPDRAELGDMDRATWPIDRLSGQKKDPWQQVSRVILYRTKGDEDGLFTFVTRSHGGRAALGKLATQVGKELRMRPNCYPVVALQADSYRHLELGTTVDIPVFELAGWDDKPWTGAQIKKVA